jgi:hypothetical protein
MKKITILILFFFVFVSFAHSENFIEQEELKKVLAQTFEKQKQKEEQSNKELRKRLSNIMRRYKYIPEVSDYIYKSVKSNPNWMIKNIVFWESNNPSDKTVPWLKIISSDGERTFNIDKQNRDKLENARILDYLWHNPKYFDEVSSAREQLFKDMRHEALGFLKDLPPSFGLNEKGYYGEDYNDKGERIIKYYPPDYVASFSFAPYGSEDWWWKLSPKCEHTLWYLDLEVREAGMSMVQDDTYKYKCEQIYYEPGLFTFKEKKAEVYASIQNQHTTLYMISSGDKDFKDGIPLNFWPLAKWANQLNCADDYIYYFANHNKSNRVQSKLPFKFKKYKTYRINDYIKDPKFKCIEGYLF